MTELQDKKAVLEARLRELGSVVVAYSGGVDSAFLALMAHRVLGNKALAVTAVSESYPEWERKEALAIASDFGLAHKLIETSELAIDSFADNPPDRCYYCKSELFQILKKAAREAGLENVADGTTADDLNDHRPGRRAACELGIASPLLESGMTKDDVRDLSRELELPTWDKPSFACLASRFPYGEKITAAKLEQVDQAELFLREQGIRQSRVRHYGDLARIEVEQGDLPLLAGKLREACVERMRELGFLYVTLDLEGYRTGSMNRVLDGEGEE